MLHFGFFKPSSRQYYNLILSHPKSYFQMKNKMKLGKKLSILSLFVAFGSQMHVTHLVFEIVSTLFYFIYLFFSQGM